MTLMEWLRGKLMGARSTKRYDTAIERTEEMTVAAKSLREQIEPFRKSHDPFAAMRHARDLADAANREVGA